jgi:hypothetical protein
MDSSETPVLYTGRTVLKVKPRERAFKQFKSPVLSVLKGRMKVERQLFFASVLDGGEWSASFTGEGALCTH